MPQVGQRSRSSVLTRHWTVGAIVGAVVGTAAYLLVQGWAAGPGSPSMPLRRGQPGSSTGPASPGLAGAAQGAPAVPAPGPEVVAVLDVDALLEVRREERDGEPLEEAGEPRATSPGGVAGQRLPLPVGTVVPEVPPQIPLSRD